MLKEQDSKPPSAGCTTGTTPTIKSEPAAPFKEEPNGDFPNHGTPGSHHPGTPAGLNGLDTKDGVLEDIKPKLEDLGPSSHVSGEVTGA